MRVETLDYFLEIVKCGSFTQAAENLYISQQGLSKAIKSLEKELDISLFEKEGKRVVLSSEGEILRSYAKDITGKCNDLKGALLSHSVAADPSPFAGVTLYAMPYVCNSLFDLLRDEMDEYCLCDCIVKEHNLGEIIYRLERSSGFALISVLKDNFDEVECSSLRFVPLFSMEITVLASRLLVEKRASKTITPQELAELPLAYYNEPVLNCFMGKLFESAGLQPSGLVQHTTNCDSIRRLLRSGKAATFCDTFSLSARKQAEGVISLKMEPSQEVYVGFLANGKQDERCPENSYMKRFCAMLKTYHGAYLGKHPVPVLRMPR